MIDPFDVDLRDGELEAEIRLLTDLMVAASECPGPLNQTTIDEVLSSSDQVDQQADQQVDSQAIIPPPRSPE